MKSVREYELEACDVGRWKFERHKCSPSPSLPHEIIEIILSRLPVKDLLRFRVVCKKWEATISNPAFAEIHLQHHKNPSSPNLLAWDNFLELHVVELRNNCIEFVSAIEFGLGRDSKTLCSCDGLYLRYFPMDKKVLPVKCVLWNPSSRTYRELYCPPSVDVLRITRSVHAMYYDPLMKDYKIVIADLHHYAVYSCRDNKWSDVKDMKGFLGEHCSYKSVFVDGSIYWLAFKESFREIICFDCEDESFKTLPLLNLQLNRDEYHFQLTSFGGQLCLLITEYKSGGRIKIMKKVGSCDEWRESKEECLCDYRPQSYLESCELSENEILLQEMRKSFLQDTRKSLFQMFYMVYDKRRNTLVEIHNNHMPGVHLPIPSPYVENLFLL